MHNHMQATTTATAPWLIPIPQEAIDRLFDRYQNVYGQNSDARR